MHNFFLGWLAQKWWVIKKRPNIYGGPCKLDQCLLTPAENGRPRAINNIHCLIPQLFLSWKKKKLWGWISIFFSIIWRDRVKFVWRFDLVCISWSNFFNLFKLTNILFNGYSISVRFVYLEMNQLKMLLL